MPAGADVDLRALNVGCSESSQAQNVNKRFIAFGSSELKLAVHKSYVDYRTTIAIDQELRIRYHPWHAIALIRSGPFIALCWSNFLSP